MRICTLGDVLLDVIVQLDAPIVPDTDTYGRTRVGPGGQAANVAAWIVALGAHARCIAKRARDPAGRLVAEELGRRGVELAGPEVDGRTGTIVSVATPDGRRTMLSDRGVAPELEPAELDRAWLKDCDWLHVSGYSLARSPLRETSLAAASLATHVSLDVSSTSAVEEAGVQAFRRAVRALEPRIVFANEDEAALVEPLEARSVVVKRGARGCLVREDGAEREHPAVRADVVDSTGAGDAFTAGYLVGGPELALRAAARCIAQLGAMP